MPRFRFRRPLSRRILLYTSASLLFLLLVTSLTPIISPLPPYTGQYEVGILDLETAVPRRAVHSAVLKETGEKAFELATLALTLYYPSALPSSPAQPWARPWLPQPVSLVGTGYARLVGVRFAPLQALVTFFLWAFGANTVIPGVVDAPVLMGANATWVGNGNGNGEGLGKVIQGVGMDGKAKGEEVVELRGVEDEGRGLRTMDEERTLPCVVFTHGMAGMSQSYSHYLGSIASHGYVVAAVEHRDGSGPGSIVHYPDGGERYVWHIKLEDLE